MDEKTKIKYIAAFTYGDGYIGYHGKNCRFQANNIIDNKDYIEWRASILENITRVTMTTNRDDRENRRTIIKTFTMTHPIYTRVHSRFYLNGTKVIDPHYLKLLDWETMAIWYMDDGSLRVIKQDYKENYYEYLVPTLSTNCFTYGDQELIKKAVKERLGVEFNINKHSKNKAGEQTYLMALQRSSADKFLENVSPYILPSFMYKISPYVEPITGNADGGETVRSN